MVYQINSAQLFLTYPECPLPKESALDFFQNKFNIENYVVASERHANGNSHLHVYLKLREAIRTTDSRFADLPGGYHGNYQGCRSRKNVLKYCTKDEDYISDLDIGALVSKSGSRAKDFDELLTRKRTLDELLLEKPQYLINYNSLTLSLKAYWSNTLSAKEPMPMWLPNPWSRILPIKSEKIKKRHYHFWSRGPNTGKTTFANSLREYGASVISNKEQYWTIEPFHRFIILDEFNTARLRYDELNAMADGTYSYRLFGRGIYQYPLDKLPYIIILGNIPLDELYPHMHELLFARYQSYDLTNFKF